MATSGSAATTAPPSEVDEPLFEPSGSSTKTILRRVAVVLVSILLVAFLFVGACFRATNAALGTPARATTTFDNAVYGGAAVRALAVKVVNAVIANSPAADRASITSHRPELENLAAVSMMQEANAARANGDVRDLWHATVDGDKLVLDYHTLVGDILTPMHAAVPAVSANPYAYAHTMSIHNGTEVDTSYIITIDRHTPVGFANSLGVFGGVLTALGLVGTVLVARFLVRHRPVQLLHVGLVIGAPGLIVIAFGRSLGNADKNATGLSPLTRTVIHDVLSTAGGTLSHEGVLQLVAAAGVLLVWGGWRLFRAGTARAVPTGT